MYQRGRVKEIDVQRARGRVIFPAADHLVSWWLDILQPKAYGDKHIWLPDIGAEVACLVDKNGESGCILGGVYTLDVVPPNETPDCHETVYSDGTRIRYDRAVHHLDIDLARSGTATIAGGLVTINADVVINGAVDISGSVTIGGTLSTAGAADFGATGTFVGPVSTPALSWTGGGVTEASGMTISGPLNISGGDVTADGIGLKAHVHISAGPGTPTSKPR